MIVSLRKCELVVLDEIYEIERQAPSAVREIAKLKIKDLIRNGAPHNGRRVRVWCLRSQTVSPYGCSPRARRSLTRNRHPFFVSYSHVLTTKRPFYLGNLTDTQYLTAASLSIPILLSSL